MSMSYKSMRKAIDILAVEESFTKSEFPIHQIIGIYLNLDFIAFLHNVYAEARKSGVVYG